LDDHLFLFLFFLCLYYDLSRTKLKEKKNKHVVRFIDDKKITSNIGSTSLVSISSGKIITAKSVPDSELLHVSYLEKKQSQFVCLKNLGGLSEKFKCCF
jgi:hypothetical protein